MTVAVPSGSTRSSLVIGASRRWATSPHTASKTSAGGTARATRVATRRNAACSSTIRRSSLWLVSSESPMVLKARSSTPISATPVSGSRTARSPAASRPAMVAARRTGRTIVRVRYPVRTRTTRSDPATPPPAASVARRAAASERSWRVAASPSSNEPNWSNSFRRASTRRFPSWVTATVSTEARSRRAASTVGTE